MKTLIPIEEAVGMVLPHDVTEIRPQGAETDTVASPFKGRAFRKGHIIRSEDIPHFKRLGKEHIYVLSLEADEMHENEAAELMAKALCGQGAALSGEPVEGKINILADRDGLLKINKDALLQFNMLGEVMCATLHTDSFVTKGQSIAGTRLIPLVGKRELVEKAASIAADSGGIITVLPVKKLSVGLVITGNEVFTGRIKDAFEPVLREKLGAFGCGISDVRFAPDDPQIIAGEISACIKNGAEMIVTSGGMSVDPDDVTRAGIALAGAENFVYGTPVLPGAMFLVAAIGAVPVMGLPACGMFHRITIFDILLPRVLAGEKISREDIAALGHGGLCLQCAACRYPVCPFGK